MRCYQYLFALLFAMLQFQTLSFAAPMNNQDNANLINAIEDYRFSDYDTAISSLEKLHTQFPSNIQALQYLALSYQENNQPKKANSMFKTWLKTMQNSTQDETRFAWLGLAQTYTQLNESTQAINTLQTWLQAHPDDISTQITLGDLLVRNQHYAQANKIWDMVLQSSESKDHHKAAAWYYKALTAYSNNNTESAIKYADTSLLLDGEGPYAAAAKKIKKSPSRKRLGLYGSASFELFYDNNVRLIPDSLTATQHGGDKGMQANLFLNWGMQNTTISYLLSTTKHEDFNEYDMMFHMLSATWENGNWKLKPSYENVSLDSDALYQSIGLGAFYTQQDWTYHYTGKVKSFSDSFGTNNIDLGRLGGSNHHLGAQTNFIFQDIQMLFSTHLIAELTKGDASHDNSDSYYQLGGYLSANFPLATGWDIQAKLDLYARQYAAADTNILLSSTDTTKRSDFYSKISAATTWKPWQDYNFNIVMNLSYQNNASNYDSSLVIPTSSKAYSSWRVGTMVSTYW